MTTMFKITFNKPAFKMFFQGEDAEGVRIKVEGRTVLFLPIQRIGEQTDVTMITEKCRGGAETMVEGSQEAHLFALLTNPLGNPYFLLRRATGGWMEAVPHNGPKHAPERWEPHIRIWPLETAGPSTITEPLDLRTRGATAFVRDHLPASEEARETLLELETTLHGVTQVPLERAYAAVHSAQSLIRRFLAHCQDNPLPNQKARKPRAKTIPLTMGSPLVVSPPSHHTSIGERTSIGVRMSNGTPTMSRRQRTRVFSHA